MATAAVVSSSCLWESKRWPKVMRAERPRQMFFLKVKRTKRKIEGRRNREAER
jgi:hypothetical protein